MRIKLDWGQTPTPKAAPGTAIIKLRDFEETPLPDWEAWAGSMGSDSTSLPWQGEGEGGVKKDEA